MTSLGNLQKVTSSKWREFQDTIEGEIERKDKIVGIYIESNSGSGKSTGLFPLLVNRELRKHANTTAVMIVRTADEKRIMERSLKSAEDGRVDNDIRTQVLIMTRAQFLQLFSMAPDPVTILFSVRILFCDVEVLSTTEDEIFWGRLVESVMAVKNWDSKHQLILCLCASYRSDRTLKTFRDKVDPKMKALDYYTDLEPVQAVINWEEAQVDHWKNIVNWDANPEARVVVVGRVGLQHLQFPVQKQKMHVIEGSKAVLEKENEELLVGGGDTAQVLQVGHDIEWAITLPSVDYVFLNDRRNDVQLDQEVGLLVRDERMLTKTELLQRQSWLWRTRWWRDHHKQDIGLTKAVAAYSEEDLRQRPDDCAKVSPAWNENAMLTMLAYINAWPNRHPYHMPARAPPSLALWIDTYPVLHLARVIDNNDQATDLGELVASMASTFHWSWAEAYIVAFVCSGVGGRKAKGGGTQLERREYLVLLMAAIIGVETEDKRTMVRLKKGVAKWPSDEGDNEEGWARMRCCAGGAKTWAANGSLWLQTGIYRKVHNEGVFRHDQIDIRRSGFDRVGERMKAISELLEVEHYEPGMAYDVDPDDVGLSRDDALWIEKVLAKVFAGQMMIVTPDELSPHSPMATCFHVASGATLEVSANGDMLNIEDRLRGTKGIHFFSYRPMEVSGQLLRPGGLTYMRAKALTDMAADLEYTWPDRIKRRHWPKATYVYKG